MKIDQALLEAALIGYMHRRDEVEAKIQEIQRQLGGASRPSSGGREMSVAARARISAAQRKRWAAFHNAGEKPAAKRRLSPAARKRIADATRKRWIAYRAQKAAAQKAAQKAAAPKKRKAASAKPAAPAKAAAATTES